MRERLARVGAVNYQVERHNEQWYDHRLRTMVTASTIAWLAPQSVMDPACGDASIVSKSLAFHSIKHVYLNDISKPNMDALEVAAGLRLALTATHLSNLPIEEVMSKVTGVVDVVVLTEILEHLPDPDAILRLARERGTYLVASSPEMRPGQRDTNPEHLWQFDEVGYLGMLTAAGWKPINQTRLRFPKTEYDFGIWVCE